MSVNIEVIKCKYCGGSDMKRYGTYNGTQLWWCPKCERKQTGKDTLLKRKYYAEAKRRQRARQKSSNPTSSIVVTRPEKKKP